eukprot:TRINITY_DN20201_c0_g1_i1.p1 TRINITY_DN20201_c0_g1~~TRINITY_DN20201_c0_g1_i1.p1  ORF type:complete len:286 (+),score=19.22 TRINITY_DN20201_c0_g1_i1:49-858(+)
MFLIDFKMSRTLAPLCAVAAATWESSQQRQTGQRRVLTWRSARRQLVACQGQDSTSLPEDAQVKLVQVLTRHGARTPLGLLDGMPEPDSVDGQALWGLCRSLPPHLRFKAQQSSSSTSTPTLTTDAGPSSAEAEYIPCRRGQLTKKGEQDHQKVGTYLHRRYMAHDSGKLQLFSDSGTTPSSSEVQILSTNTSRTILSARSLLRGAFPAMSEHDIDGLIRVPHPSPLTESLFANYCDEQDCANHFTTPESRKVDCVQTIPQKCRQESGT